MKGGRRTREIEDGNDLERRAEQLLWHAMHPVVLVESLMASPKDCD